MSNQQVATREERIESRIDQTVMGDLAMAGGGARTPTFANMRDVLEFAKVMSVSGIAIRAHLRGNPGACAAIIMQAQRWEMDPFTVANKSLVVNDQISYESQLITAVINTRAPIKGRLKTRFKGEGAGRTCFAYATFKGEDEPTEIESPPFSQITPKNSPLWKSDPDQQMRYYTKRAWARAECPEVLLGVYDPEELAAPAAHQGPEHAKDITPARPTRQSTREMMRDADKGSAMDASTVSEEQTDQSAGVVTTAFAMIDCEGVELTWEDPDDAKKVFAQLQEEVADATQRGQSALDGLLETNAALIDQLALLGYRLPGTPAQQGQTGDLLEPKKVTPRKAAE